MFLSIGLAYRGSMLYIWGFCMRGLRFIVYIVGRRVKDLGLANIETW